MSKAVPIAVLIAAVMILPSALAGSGPGVAQLLIVGAPAGPVVPGVGVVFDSAVAPLKSWTLNTGALVFSCDGATSKGSVKNGAGQSIATGVACASAPAPGVPLKLDVQFGRFFVFPQFYTMAGTIVDVPLP